MEDITRRKSIQMSASPQVKVDGMIRHDKDFLKILSEKLMLDELLCGEQDAYSFLVEAMKDSVVETSLLRDDERSKRSAQSIHEWRNQ